MGPPRDRLAAMQQSAYIEEGDDYAMNMQEQMDGKFIINIISFSGNIQYSTKIKVFMKRFNDFYVSFRSNARVLQRN